MASHSGPPRDGIIASLDTNICTLPRNPPPVCQDSRYPTPIPDAPGRRALHTATWSFQSLQENMYIRPITTQRETAREDRAIHTVGETSPENP